MTNDSIEIVRLAQADVTAGGGVLDAAFGRQGMAIGLGLALALQPESWFCARRDKRIVALVGAYDYGPVASIGMMAVHPSVQRQGVGANLMAALIAYLEDRGCPVLFLDASAAGQYLYPKLNFIAEGETLRMTRPWPPPRVAAVARSEGAVGKDVAVSEPHTRDDIEEMIAFDAPIFGANRSAVIWSFCAANPPGVFLARDTAGRMVGYLITSQTHIGPWVATSSSAASALLSTALRLPFKNPVYTTCPAANDDAIALLSAHGFVVSEQLLHMRRGGAADPRRTEHIYSQASLTLG